MLHPTDISDPRVEFGQPGHSLPEWVKSFRPAQEDALAEVDDAFDDGADVVFLGAPTGSGKTLLGEAERMIRGARGLYICSGIALQDQFAADFHYARVLKGRSNYRPQYGEGDVTCADCTDTTGKNCMLCEDDEACPYLCARNEALSAQLAVVNTAYFLREANGPGKFSKRPFVVADECDTLEGELMNAIEFRLAPRLMKQVEVETPVKGARRPTLVKWLNEVSEKLKSYGMQLPHDTIQAVRIRRNVLEKAKDAAWIAGEITRDIELIEDDDVATWVRDYSDDERSIEKEGAAPFVYKPVTVQRYGDPMLWQHGKRWLMMSASIISAEQMADDLGLTRNWAYVEVPMQFPVKNRPIILAPIASMSMKNIGDSLPKIAAAIDKVCERHPGERILVHTVSYHVTKQLMKLCKCRGREKITYYGADWRDRMIDKYRRTKGAVFFAPSLERGVDFKDDDCRVVVIAKTPYPYLGDAQVATRKRLPGGDGWYTVQTVRSIVQMTGRGVRHERDHCVTYILDRDFLNTWKSHKRLFPSWWREAVDTKFPVRELRG